MNQNYFSFQKLKNAFLGIFTFFVVCGPLFGDVGTELPSPPIPIANAGKYAPKIIKIQKLLDENKIWEFYNEIRLFSGEKKANWSAMGCPREQKDGEEALKVANEWLFYLLAKAPWIPTDEYVAKETLDSNKVPNFDNIMKQNLFEILTGESMFFLGEYMFFFKDKDGFDLLHVKYAISLLRAGRANEIKYMAEFETTKKKPLITSNKMPIVGSHMEDFYYRQSGKHLDPVLEKRSRSLSRQSALTYSIESLNGRRELFIRIIECFPRNGEKVQEYIKKNAYESFGYYKKFSLTPDEMCLLLLDKYFPMTKETAYLYKGLPLEKLSEIEEKIKKINAEISKQKQTPNKK
jgi:hypothetical protein